MLCNEPVVADENISRLNLRIKNVVSLREESYLSLLHFTNPQGAYQAM